jgi:predicted exporter
VRASLEEAQLEELYALYFPRRHYFLSDRPEREIPSLLEEAALRERALALRRRLASPASTALDRVAPADPLGAFEAIVGRLRAGESSLRMRRGHFVSADGRFAILLAATRASAFDSGAQAPLLDDLGESFEAIARRLGGGLELEIAFAGRIAVDAERRMKRDVYLIAACSFLGVAALFLAFVGSLRGFLIVAVPPLAGILVATSLGLAVFGNLDGLTMAFGASLMGIAIDYSIHLLIHRGLAPAAETPPATVRRIRPSLVLGALTTVASVAGLGFTAFPAFREMSFFAAVGVLAALAASLFVLPSLLASAPALPARSAATAARLGRMLGRLERAPRALLLLPLAAGAGALIALPRLEWSDDVSRLGGLDPDLVEEDRRVRERVSRVDSGRFVVGLAPDAPAAVALADRIHGRLEGAVETGALEGARSVHALIWSEELQRRNRAALLADPELYPRIDAVFASEGFRRGAFQPFAEALAAAPPPPLRLADLQASPLAELLVPYLFPLGDELAVVSHLDGVHSPEAVRAALAGLEGVFFLDQRSFLNDVYREFRVTTLRQMLVGGALVLLLLGLRYRAVRPVLAAFLPSLTVALLLLALLAVMGVEANLVHVMSLVMVMGMGVDYGVFLVDSAREPARVGATMLSLLVSCLTTVFVFGTLALSSQPALRAIGITTGLGILLSYLVAPLALAALGIGDAGERRRG